MASEKLRTGNVGGLGYRVLRYLVRSLLRVGWALRVEGLARLPQRGPYILTPNHGSEIDPLILLAALPFRCTFLGSRHLEQFPVLFWIIKGFAVFVRRGLSDVGAIKACLERLKRGEVLVVFPEGRVVQEPDLGPMHPGAAFLAIRGRVAVVPVAMIGLAQMWPLGARWPRRSRVTIRIGEPISSPEANGDRAVEMTELIGRTLRSLLATRE